VLVLVSAASSLHSSVLVLLESGIVTLLAENSELAAQLPEESETYLPQESKVTTDSRFKGVHVRSVPRLTEEVEIETRLSVRVAVCGLPLQSSASAPSGIAICIGDPLELQLPEVILVISPHALVFTVFVLLNGDIVCRETVEERETL
jgi:hypothetical protein